MSQNQNQNPNSLNSQNPTEIEPKTTKSTNSNSGQKPHYPNPPETSSYAGQKPHYPNPPDASIPDSATLRDQWRYATRQYSRWYSQAWGAAILAGVSFFALGWVIKGSNPLPSRHDFEDKKPAENEKDGK